jgi:hypothetical protein
MDSDATRVQKLLDSVVPELLDQRRELLEPDRLQNHPVKQDELADQVAEVDDGGSVVAFAVQAGHRADDAVT